MDDPWGSPWASTDTNPDANPPSSSRADTFLSPPPKAFFGNGTAQSPWSGNHDDGASAFGPHPAGVQPPRLSPRLSASGKESPLAWPENAATSPALMPTARSRTPSILRYHSPDPWAAELSLTNRSDAELPSSLGALTGDAPTIVTGQVGEASQASQKVAAGLVEKITNNEKSPSEEEFATRQISLPRISPDLAEDRANTSSKLDSTVYVLPSRPSSTCTIDSHDGPERQDSPITSIDEDRGVRMQSNVRKTSGKVQELVGIYDGLAKAVSEEPPALGRSEISHTTTTGDSSAPSKLEDDGVYSEVGFGHFEDAPTDDGRAPRSPSGESLLEFPSTPEAEPKDVSTHGREEGDGITTETAPFRSPNVVNKYRDLKFDTNLSSVDKLFPDLLDSRTNCYTGDGEIPDHVISDSFTTISERKGWYRISRYGSLRQHNSGGDDNYHRVTWPTSQLHSDTIKIVRRWMEEDTYAGKATLGGTKRTGFFDWDSDAAPVDLGEVFRRKKSVTNHMRTASIPANHAVIQIKSADERPYRNSTGISLAAELQSPGQPITPAPSLRWNTEAEKTPVTSHFSHNGGQNLNSAPIPTPLSTPIQTTFTDEDDDDWGEMVSSPRASNDQIEPNVSAFPLPEITTTKLEPTPRSPLIISHINQPEGVKHPPSPEAQPLPSGSWSFPDVSVLDSPQQAPVSSTIRTPQTGEIFATLETDTPLPNQDSFEVLNQGVAIKREPSDNMLTGQAAVKEAVNATATASSPPEVDVNQDDKVVQDILQNLPDLSYMFR
ncbi:hypothetical protein EKO27_g10739 [Xylaria grammica]|uniref:Uncharacterized protein n=1 Tax=Xylaria grammica TaxID=363999 RepID=A0A439CQE4_9PEZI|nr:hypothetical protein EKO27_g10739 [Xylaria grammica]